MAVLSTLIPSTYGYHTELVEGGVSVVERYAREWSDLLHAADVRTPFYRPEWIGAYLRSFSPSAVRLLLVRSGANGALRAILPLTSATSSQLGVSIQQLTGAANIHSGRFDCVVAAGEERERVLQAMARGLETLPDWDVIQLPYVPEDGSCDALLKEVERAGRLVGRRPAFDTPFVDVGAQSIAEEDWFATVTDAHFRQNLRRRLRKAEAQWRVELKREVRATAEALAQFFALEAKGWKGEEGTAIQCSPDTLRFYTEIAELATVWKGLRLYTLTFDDQPVAAHFGLVYDRRYYALKVAYDEEFSEYGPGQMIIAAILQDCQKAGVVEFDFLGPSMDWKRRWATGHRAHSFVYIFNHTARARLVYALKFRLLPLVRNVHGRATELIDRKAA